MYEITQQTQTLQVNSKRICRRSFTIVEDSIDNHGLSSGTERSYRKFKRLIRRLGGRCDWPNRRIAKYLGIGKTTCKDHLRELRSAGLICVEHRKNARGCRHLNDTNVYTLPVGGGSKIGPQKLKQELKPNTTTPREVARVKSYAQIRWEWNQARRQHHPGPHVGRCRMRFTQAFFQPTVVNPKPDSELTLQEKAEIDAIRKRLGEPPLFGGAL